MQKFTSSEPQCEAVSGGAGFGNKSSDGFSKSDSTIGKAMEKVGSTIGSKHITTHGQERRSTSGYEPEVEK